MYSHCPHRSFITKASLYMYLTLVQRDTLAHTCFLDWCLLSYFDSEECFARLYYSLCEIQPNQAVTMPPAAMLSF